ncbi:chorismate mutase [Fluoribacter gormanii]|uniref:chorismate mutase n=1 Tax=Fluoribacter gormanii TaxID=464 RepID=UPI001041A1AE|nr:chorismate mutase [Fluoribacter gormanii]
MQAAHYELVRLMHMRMDYVHIIASLKFILKKPIYAPAVEKDQCHHLIEMASQFDLDASLIRHFMKVLCKISRETQRKMHAIWSLDKEGCVQFLWSQVNHMPILQLKVLKNKLHTLNEHDLYLCDQLIHLLRFSIRFIDMQIIGLFSSVTNTFSLSFIKEHFVDWYQFSNNTLLYKLFLLVNKFVNREIVCC